MLHLPGTARTSDRGTLTIALILVVFILMFATLVTATLSWQVAGDRVEQRSRLIATHADTVFNIAAQNLGTTTQGLHAIPFSAPASWTPDSAGTYFYRWWVQDHSDLTLTVHAQVRLDQGEAVDGYEIFTWNPITSSWTPSSVTPT